MSNEPQSKSAPHAVLLVALATGAVRWAAGR